MYWLAQCNKARPFFCVDNASSTVVQNSTLLLWYQRICTDLKWWAETHWPEAYLPTCAFHSDQGRHLPSIFQVCSLASCKEFGLCSAYQYQDFKVLICFFVKKEKLMSPRELASKSMDPYTVLCAWRRTNCVTVRWQALNRHGIRHACHTHSLYMPLSTDIGISQVQHLPAALSVPSVKHEKTATLDCNSYLAVHRW